MPEVGANGLTLHYESMGREGDPVILLVMGLAMQMIMWPDALCERQSRRAHPRPEIDHAFACTRRTRRRQ